MGLFAPRSLVNAGWEAAGSQQAEDSPVVLLGFLQEGATRRGILGWEGLVFLVREGDTILGRYRVEHLGEDSAILRDGEAVIRVSFRPKPPGTAHPQPAPPGATASGDPGLPAPQQLPGALVPSRADSPADPWTGGSAPGVGLPPASPFGVANPAAPSAPGQDDNPFARALRERAPESPPAATTQDNPFLRALRERAAAAASPYDNPFLRALQQRAPSPPGHDNPFLRALREQGR
jgi:hypothetical protein